ncbi:MAG: ferredoxin family protein [Rhodospirillales bacterium]|nr:ferredoxin family protein [Rhodospirillales bacterium]
MLYINPEECIDCDACPRACPADAIFIESEVPEKWQSYIQINADFDYAKAQSVTSMNDVTKGKNWDAETAAKKRESNA